MLKFVKHNLEAIDDVQIYPIISLVIFFLFFVVLFYRVFTASKGYIEEMVQMPLNDELINDQQNEK